MESSKVNVHEAKTHLSRLLERVLRGEEVVIARGHQPVARLVPAYAVAKRTPGSARGKAIVKKGFERPLPSSLLKTFEK